MPPPTPYGRALVLGLGRSGVAAARLLRAEGAAVTVLDRQDAPALARGAEALRAQGITVQLGKQVLSDGSFDVVVLSPGIASDSPWVRAVVPPGTPVIAELELGASRCACPLLAITGTNGKSTLTKLCTEALRLAGKRAEAGGNYGVPLAELAMPSRALDWIVVEVSSFQLETVAAFRPRVGVLLNLQPNHLDRHGDMATYAGLKARLFRRMGAGDVALVLDTLADETRTRVAGMAGGGGGLVWRTFGAGNAAEYRYATGGVDGPGGRRLGLHGTRFDNPVLGPAAAAAWGALTACGVPDGAVAEALRGYAPLPHRMQEVGTVRGVRFINDSKATTLAAMCAGLAMAPGPVRLIAGGLLKEGNLENAQEMLAKHARALYVIGKSAPLMQRAWSGAVPCRDCGTLSAAVRQAWGEAERGDVVLLSPGCASFDQFKSFEERGALFESLVRSIREGEGHENVASG